MQFFSSAVDTLQTLVIALGAGLLALGVWAAMRMGRGGVS